MEERWTFSFSRHVKKSKKAVFSRSDEAKLLKQLQRREFAVEEMLLKVSRFYSETNQPGRALAYMKRLKICTHEPETKAFCYLSMGQFMQQARDFKSALAVYTKGFMLEPTRKTTWYFLQNNLASCLNHFERYEEAEWYCREAIKVRPSYHLAYKTLGISLRGQDLHAEAAEAFIRAVRMDASDPVSLRLLEELVQSHPEIVLDVKDIHKQLKKCRLAVRISKQLRDSGEK